MSPLAKSTILSLSPLAGAAASAYAQSENIAKLPPSAAVTPPPAAAGPSTVFLGPDPGTSWPASHVNTGAVQPSSQQLGALPRNGVGTDFE
jgi:hypothetical protein